MVDNTCAFCVVDVLLLRDRERDFVDDLTVHDTNIRNAHDVCASL
jgi:hypothetical protein